VLRKKLFLPVTGPSPWLRVHHHLLRHHTLRTNNRLNISLIAARYTASPEGTIRD
jgi:hypothetical protein